MSDEILGSTADLRSQPDSPGGKGEVTVFPCDLGAYGGIPTTPNEPGFQALNARMLALPLYVFVREAPARNRSDRVIRVAVAGPKGRTLPSLDRLRELLGPLLQSDRIELKELEIPEYLAEDLTAEKPAFDAVALYGEEPSTIFERFLARYQVRASGRGQAAEPGLLTQPGAGTSAHVMRKTRAELAFILLEYPRESLYAFRAAKVEGQATEGLMVGLSRSSIGGPTAESRIPLLLTDAVAKLKSGSLRPCCWQALKRAFADSALLSVRWIDGWLGKGSASGPERQVSRDTLERVLVVDAFLAGRGEGGSTPDREEIIRGLLLLAHLQLAGYDATLRRVQASTKLVLSNDGREVLARLGLPADVTARLGFSCDTAVQRVSAATRALSEKQTLAPEEIQQMLSDLAAAISAQPGPARHRAGCGMTQLAAYNPYLPLAQVMSMQRRAGVTRAQDATGTSLRIAGVVLIPIETVEGPDL